MVFHRQLNDEELTALIDNACSEVSERTARRTVRASLATEIVDRRLATHASIASALAELRAAPERSGLLEPLRRALRREASLLVTSYSEDGTASDQLLRDVDDVMSPNSIDCLMVAAGHDITVANDVLGEALGTVLERAGIQAPAEVPASTTR